MDSINYPYTNPNNNTNIHIEAPATRIAPNPQVGQQPTPYDYLTLLVALITALTPLILGLKNKGKKNKNVNDSSQ